jgi:hypothetical protein
MLDLNWPSTFSWKKIKNNNFGGIIEYGVPMYFVGAFVWIMSLWWPMEENIRFFRESLFLFYLFMPIVALVNYFLWKFNEKYRLFLKQLTLLCLFYWVYSLLWNIWIVLPIAYIGYIAYENRKSINPVITIAWTTLFLVLWFLIIYVLQIMGFNI